MTTSLTVNKEWYEEIKNIVKTYEPYFYKEDGREMVEFDANEKEFNRVSKELGWME